MKRTGFLFFSYLFIGSMLFWACSNEYEGIAPDPSKIHYPIGIGVHPSGEFLYVVNSNFDLAYTGGSVMVFGTKEFEPKEVPGQSKVAVFGINTEWKTLKIVSKATVAIGSFAAQLVVNRAGDRIYIASRQDRILGSFKPCTSSSDCSSNEECSVSLCRPSTVKDLSSILTLRIDPSRKAEGHLSCGQVKVPDALVGGVGEEYQREQKPAPRCGDSSKVFLENNPAPYGVALAYECQAKRSCKADKDCACSKADKDKGLCSFVQRCDFNRCVDGCQKDSDCSKDEGCSAGRCLTKSPSGKSCKSDAACGAGKRCDKGSCSKGCSFDRECISGERCTEGRCLYPLSSKKTLCESQKSCAAWEECRESRLYATHLKSGGLTEVSLASFTKGSTSKSKATLKGLSNLPLGMTSIALLHAAKGVVGNGSAFLSSRLDNNLYVLPPHFQALGTSSFKRFTLEHSENTRASDFDLRGIAVGYDKKNKWTRLYVASRSPASILVYDLQQNETSKAIELKIIRAIPVGSDPAQIIYRERKAPNSDLLYVVCSRKGRIDVIDTQSFQVIHQIKVGQRPYFMAIHEATSSSTFKKNRAYVANFLETTISIIDLDKHSVIGLVTGIDTTPKYD